MVISGLVYKNTSFLHHSITMPDTRTFYPWNVFQNVACKLQVIHRRILRNVNFCDFLYILSKLLETVHFDFCGWPLLRALLQTGGWVRWPFSFYSEEKPGAQNITLIKTFNWSFRCAILPFSVDLYHHMIQHQKDIARTWTIMTLVMPWFCQWLLWHLGFWVQTS